MRRTEAGREPYDRALINLAGELSTRSDDFRNFWAGTRRTSAQHLRQRLRHPDRRRLRPLSYASSTMISATSRSRTGA
jgi:hypothetical protein